MDRDVGPSASPVRDPVCGMSVDPATAKGGSFVHDGQSYYFCNPRCRDTFRAAPHSYVTGSDAVQEGTAPPPTGAEYVCPMHPEIVRSQPGACPICGMAL